MARKIPESNKKGKSKKAVWELPHKCVNCSHISSLLLCPNCKQISVKK